MRILVLGATGMLGHKLIQALAPAHCVVGTVREPAVMADERFACLRGLQLVSGVQAEDFSTVATALTSVRPEAVINCIGLIKQSERVSNPIAGIGVNALFPHLLAQECLAKQARLIHFSTDCVFSGKQGRPYSLDDIPDPPDLYGRSKLLGELTAPNCLTLRTSVIGRELRGRRSLVEWCLQQRGRTVKGYAKALYSGVTTQVMGRLIRVLLERHTELSGIWQVASNPISKYDLLQLLNQKFHLGMTVERDEQFVCDRRLDGAAFAATVGFVPPSWDEMVSEMAIDPTVYPPTEQAC